MSKCLGMLRSWGLGSVVQPRGRRKRWPGGRSLQTDTCIILGAVRDAITHAGSAPVHLRLQPLPPLLSG